MLGNRARSLQSKFFFETQSPFLLLPLLLVMTSLPLLTTTEQRYASETRTILLNLILGLMEALLQKKVHTKCLSVQLSYLSNVELWEQPIIQSIVCLKLLCVFYAAITKTLFFPPGPSFQMFIHLSPICLLLTVQHMTSNG